MKKNILFVFIILLITPQFLSAVQPVAKNTVSSSSINVAPDFSLKSITNQTISLSSLKNKSVLLFFWTTWCPYCGKELATLSRAYAGLIKDGVVLVAIDVNEPAFKVERAIKKQALLFDIFLDEDASVAMSYKILGVPTFVLINEKGEIKFKDNYFPQEYKKFLLE